MILRRLYERGVESQVFRRLYRVIDWLLELPPNLEISFREELRKIEEINNMPYITSVERLAREEGLEQGLEEGRQEGRQEGILAGKIQILQQMLNQPVVSTGDLLTEPLKVLEAKIDELMEKRVRGEREIAHRMAITVVRHRRTSPSSTASRCPQRK